VPPVWRTGALWAGKTVTYEKNLRARWASWSRRRWWWDWSEPPPSLIAMGEVTMPPDFLPEPDKWLCEGVSAHDAVTHGVCVIRMCHCENLLLLGGGQRCLGWPKVSGGGQRCQEPITDEPARHRCEACQRLPKTPSMVHATFSAPSVPRFVTPDSWFALTPHLSQRAERRWCMRRSCCTPCSHSVRCRLGDRN
jgi:hypothetical protein